MWGSRSDEELERHSQHTAVRARTGAHSGWRGSGESDVLRLSLKTGGRVSSGADGPTVGEDDLREKW